MKRYRKKVDSRDVFLPGLGRVREGEVYSGDYGRFGDFLEEIDEAPVPSTRPVPTPPPKPEVDADVEPEEVVAEFPIDGYDDMNARDAIYAVDLLEHIEDIEAVLLHEVVNKDRKTVKSALQEAQEAAD